MLLSEYVHIADQVAATASRSAKVGLIAGLLRSLSPEEIVVAIGFLIGFPRQGKAGVGFATAWSIDVPSAAVPSLRLLDLDAAIDAVLAATGSGSATRRREILNELNSRATQPESDFIRRLFTSELRQGALEGVVLEAVAAASGLTSIAVRREAMLEGDLGHAAFRALTDPTTIGQLTFEVGRPILPMLASTAKGVTAALEEMERASVEWKIDGIRVQIHKRGDEVRLFTRNLNEITAQLPEVVAAIRALPIGDAVFDGEAIGFGDGDKPDAFQTTMGRVGRRAEPAAGVRVFLFDVLHLDGVSLLDEPLANRLERLRAVAPGLQVPGTITASPDEAERILVEALERGHEGVMVKDAASLYVAGRRGKAWRKVKPVRTFDLLVLGAEWGSGRREGWLSNLHLGARTPNGFVMVGKTFKGLTDALLKWQTEEFLAREVSREGHTVFIRPEMVVEIALDGVQASKRYPGGVALRFARVKRYRPDKSSLEVDTLESLQALLHKNR